MFSYFIKQTYKSTKKGLAILASLALLFGFVLPAHAQALTASATVALSYTIGETLTILPSTGTANFDPVLLSTPVYTLITSWNLNTTRTHVNINYGLTSVASALSNGTANIPSSDIFLNANNTGSSNCTQSVAADTTLTALLTPGAICNSGVAIAITSANYSGSQTTTFVLSMTGLPISLAAGTYTGTLLVVADAV